MEPFITKVLRKSSGKQPQTLTFVLAVFLAISTLQAGNIVVESVDDDIPFYFNDDCTRLDLVEILASDFGFPNNVLNGSLSAIDVDLSAKWGLPAGSVLVSVTGASTKSFGGLFEVNNGVPVTFSFSGTVPVMSVVEHSPAVDALHRDGIIALDNVEYVLSNSSLPAGLILNSIGSNYFVENTTNSTVDGPNRYVWKSQDVVTQIQFYTTSERLINGIRLRLQPLDCPDTDGDGVSDTSDLDDDNDGILDTVEDPNLDGDNDPLTDPLDTDGDGLPNHLDIDADNDGIPDNVEAQTTEDYIAPNDDTEETYISNNGVNSSYPDGITPNNHDGEDTPDYIDLDADNDWVPDNNEGNDFNFDGIPDQEFSGTDTDGDGLDDGYEGSDTNDGFDVNDEINNPSNDLPDTDGSEDGNFSDLDDDGDGIDTPDEDANGDGDPTNDDTDGDGTPDYLDPDAGPDTDGDGVPDMTDLDDDNDGILDMDEDPNLDGDDNPLTDPLDSDDDGMPNHLDIDSDNDGIPDNVEAQTTEGYIAPNDDNEADYTSNNGLNSSYPEGIIPNNHDQEDTPDYIDLDSDNDLVPDNNEGNDFNFDGNPDQTYLGTDADGDGLDDGYEGSDINDGFDVNDEINDPANDLPDTDGTEDVNYRDINNNGNNNGNPTVTNIPIIEIEVNQMVTPNNDGKNDFLFIKGVENAKNNTLRIFNRWGKAVYEASDYNNQNNVFDGKSKGRATVSAEEYLPSGVYFYIFEYQKDNQPNISNSGYIFVSK